MDNDHLTFFLDSVFFLIIFTRKTNSLDGLKSLFLLSDLSTLISGFCTKSYHSDYVLFIVCKYTFLTKLSVIDTCDIVHCLIFYKFLLSFLSIVYGSFLTYRTLLNRTKSKSKLVTIETECCWSFPKRFPCPPKYINPQDIPSNTYTNVITYVYKIITYQEVFNQD